MYEKQGQKQNTRECKDLGVKTLSMILITHHEQGKSQRRVMKVSVPPSFQQSMEHQQVTGLAMKDAKAGVMMHARCCDLERL